MKRYIALHEIEKELELVIAGLDMAVAKLGQLAQSAGVSHNHVEDILFQDKVGKVYNRARDAKVIATGSASMIPELSKSIDNCEGNKEKHYTYVI